ncbi:MAG: hypothetical protein ACK4SL_04720 [Candidatus Paceibacteria bacterium]
MSQELYIAAEAAWETYKSSDEVAGPLLEAWLAAEIAYVTTVTTVITTQINEAPKTEVEKTFVVRTAQVYRAVRQDAWRAARTPKGDS